MGDEMYFIERILAHKLVRGKKFFLIKWQGYDESENSWEPEENINPDLVIYYETNFASENDSSLANFNNTPKRRKLNGGKSKKRKRPGKGKTAEFQEESFPDVSKDPVDNDSDPEISDENIQPCTSKDYQAANLSQAPTERAPTPPQPAKKRRVERVMGYSKFHFKEGKVYMVVKFEDQVEGQFVAHDVLRYEYPQELIDYYESNTKWDDESRFKSP